MDPNQQPQDFNKPNEPTESPTIPQFGAPQQPDFTQPAPAPSPESVAPQPAFSTPQTVPLSQPPVANGDNPGHTLGIVSIVLSVIGLPVVGIILGVISRKKSKSAGASTTLGTVGLIIGIVLTVLATLFILFLLMISMVSYGGIQDRSKQTSARSNAVRVEMRAEVYYANTGTYPETIADFEKDTNSSLSDVDATVGTTTPTDYNTIQYARCSEDGAQVSYYDPATKTVIIKSLGTASSTVAC